VAEVETRHYHGDDCPGGHIRPDGGRCVHEQWLCEHCHDDPPPGHICPVCTRTTTGHRGRG